MFLNFCQTHLKPNFECCLGVLLQLISHQKMVNFHISQLVGAGGAALLLLTGEISLHLLGVFSGNFKSCEIFHIFISHILNFDQWCPSVFLLVRYPNILLLKYFSYNYFNVRGSKWFLSGKRMKLWIQSSTYFIPKVAFLCNKMSLISRDPKTPEI